MKTYLRILFFFLLMISFAGYGQHVPLLPESTVDALHSELSGESAKRNLEYITRLHRMRGSADFKKAIDFIESRLREYKLEEIEAFQIPANGTSMYGTQKARLAWEAEFAELWELKKENDAWKPSIRLADWESMPITLAEDSESADVTAELVDVGAGTSEKDYAGKDVKGKILLISSSPAAVVALGIEKFGAVGMVSYTQNQVTAWSNEDQNLIRWGHFDSFEKTKSFCFMITLKQAANFQQRLKQGEHIMLSANVKAGQHPGFYNFVTAVIKGSDPALSSEEIVFSCHLDHQRPGANDNASGSMTILEIARTLTRLIEDKKIQRPLRTIRFIWSPEIEGTSAILAQRPDYAAKAKANIHMDMVGGGPITKSIFHVAGAPKSLPSFVADVGVTFGQFLNEQTDHYASGYSYQYSFASREGGKEPLQAVLGQFHLGSDHEVYSEGSYKIPSIYLHDWPDRYIHTNLDVAGNIDPTKLMRAGFIGAASGYYLANFTAADALKTWHVIQQRSLQRTAQAVERAHQLDGDDAQHLLTEHFVYERGVFASLHRFTIPSAELVKEADQFYLKLAEASGQRKIAEKKNSNAGAIIYKRNPAIKGPLSVFGYDYLADHYGDEKTSALRQLNYQGKWGSDYAYEALNFVDGKRTTKDIRNALTAEFGPIPLDVVEEFLAALNSIEVILK